MNGNIFLDTNVLVYAYDYSQPEKQRQAVTLLDRLVARRAGVISTQVLAEFFVATTRKIAVPLSLDEVSERLESHLRLWEVVHLTGMIVLEAARGVRKHQFSFWDAQIWATARLNQVPVVFSEDFNDMSAIEGVQFVNPFSQAFRLDEWL